MNLKFRRKPSILGNFLLVVGYSGIFETKMTKILFSGDSEKNSGRKLDTNFAFHF